MSYMLLIVEPTEQRRTRSDAEGRAVYDRMLKYAADLKKRGLLLATESLNSQSDAVRQQISGGPTKGKDRPV